MQTAIWRLFNFDRAAVLKLLSSVTLHQLGHGAGIMVGDRRGHRR